MTIRQKTITYAMGSTVEALQQATTVLTCTAALVFVDETADAADVGTADVALLGASGDFLYIGSDRKFPGYWIDMTTSPVGGTAVWEFWNGSAWTALPTVTYITGTINNLADTSAHWDDTAATGWATVAVNAITRYWIRRRNTGAYSTAGTAAIVTIADWHNLATNVEGATRTIDVPETVSRTFRNVSLKVVFNVPIVSTLDLSRIRVKVGSGTLTNLEADNAISLAANTESHTYVLRFDLTSLFVTSFTGTSHTLEVAFCALYRSLQGVAGENYVHYSTTLDITYDSDDDAAQNATQAYTVTILFDSLTAALGTTITTIGGTDAMPILTGASGFIKQVTAPTIKDLFIVFKYNSQEAGTTNYSLLGEIDTEGETTLLNFNAANNSDYYMEVIWQRLALSTAAAHSIKARVSGATGAAPVHIGGEIVVTYTYAASGVTVDQVSAIFPYMHNGMYFGGTTLAEAKHSEIKFHLPVTATLQQSGIVHYFYQNVDPGNVLIGIGGQTARSYVATPDINAGPIPTVQRFDSGGIAGAGHTLVKGWNTITIKTYADNSPRNGGGEYGYVVLNFYYTKTAGKKISHSRYLMKPYVWSIQARQLIDDFAVPIPEANYLLSNVGIAQWDFSQSQYFARFIAVSRGASAGFYYGSSGMLSELDGNWCSRFTGEDLTRFFKRFPTDLAAGRLDIETARDWYSEGGNTRFSTEMALFWHDYAITTTGASQDYAGDGSGITVNVWSKILGEKIATATTAAGGGYSFIWYDDTADDLFVESHQDSTHAARTIDFTAG